MLTDLVLTHSCGAQVHLESGVWTTPRGEVLTYCDGCGEWLGSAFTRAETSLRPALGLIRRRVRA